MENKKNLWYVLFALLAVGAFYLAANAMLFVGYVGIPKYLIPISSTQAKPYLFGVELTISLIQLTAVYLVYRRLKPDALTVQPLTGSGAVKALIAGSSIFGVNSVLNLLAKSAAGGGLKENAFSMVLFSVVFAPLIEELFFRGIVYRLLDRFKSGWFSIAVSAAIFAAYHADPVQMVFAGIMGIVFAYVYQKTGNLRYTILMHFANNAAVCLLLYAPEKLRNPLTIGMIVLIVPTVVFLVRLYKKTRDDA